MNPEFSAFLSANSTALIIVGGVLAFVGLVQWRKIRVAESESELKQAMLDKGVPVEEIEKAIVVRPPARRGLIEQFGSLSGGAKFVVVLAGLFVAWMLTGVLIVFIVFSRAGGYTSHAYAPPYPPPEVQPPPVEKADALAGHAFYLDLQPVANQKLTDVVGDNGHSLSALPQKRRDFGGVPFQVGPSYVRLQGKNRPELPTEASGVRVGFKFDKLHIFHGTEYGAFGGVTHRFHVPDGTPIGRYRVRYTDETELLIPVVYGEDVRDSWNWDSSKKVSRGRVVWTGQSTGATKAGVSLRLYLTTWKNPRPDVEVAQIDFISACDTAATPICIALTAERAAK